MELDARVATNILNLLQPEMQRAMAVGEAARALECIIKAPAADVSPRASGGRTKPKPAK